MFVITLLLEHNGGHGNHQKRCLKRCILRQLHKTGSDCRLDGCGKPFQEQ